jgi:dUTP pyrophosphatase
MKVYSKQPLYYGTPDAAAFDLPTNIIEPIILEPFGLAKIPTGLYLEVPNGHSGEITSRSSAFIKGILCCGKIDPDYRGEVFILARNITNETIIITPDKAIAQMQIVPSRREPFEYQLSIKNLSKTQRGTGGFGSTDCKTITKCL